MGQLLEEKQYSHAMKQLSPFLNSLSERVENKNFRNPGLMTAYEKDRIYYVTDYDEVRQILARFSSFNILQIAEIYKTIAEFNGKDISYIFSGYLGVSPLEGKGLQLCRNADVKAGVIIGDLGTINLLRYFDEKVLDVVRTDCHDNSKRVMEQRSLIYDIPKTFVIEAETSVKVPNQIPKGKYFNFSFFSNYPLTELNVSEANNDSLVTKQIKLEKRVLDNPIFNETSKAVMSSKIAEIIREFISAVCLYKMHNHIYRALTAREINCLFFLMYGQSLGISEEVETYNKRLELLPAKVK